jgi:hypothetical protein
VYWGYRSFGGLSAVEWRDKGGGGAEIVLQRGKIGRFIGAWAIIPRISAAKHLDFPI